MKAFSKLSAVILFLTLFSCVSYTKSITKGREMDTAFLLSKIKPGKTYQIKLRSLLEFKVKVSSIDSDSIHGTFAIGDGKQRQVMQSVVSLHDLIDIKEEKLNIARTALAISVPILIFVVSMQYGTVFDPSFTF